MATPSPNPRASEDFDLKFRAAWDVFSATCAKAVAPEATFQAWFAHYLISQVGIDRVAREPIFKHRDFKSEYQALVPGGEVKLDAVVTRNHGIHMPHYASRGGHKSGIDLIGDLAVISKLKVASTQSSGLTNTMVCRDFWKLSVLLAEADRQQLDTPLAYVCILDYHPSKGFDAERLLNHRLKEHPADPRVKLLLASRPGP